VSLGVHYAERKSQPERESRFRALADALSEHFCGVEDSAGEAMNHAHTSPLSKTWARLACSQVWTE
jgi:hypothetical protein